MKEKIEKICNDLLPDNPVLAKKNTNKLYMLFNKEKNKDIEELIRKVEALLGFTGTTENQMTQFERLSKNKPVMVNKVSREAKSQIFLTGKDSVLEEVLKLLHQLKERQ